MEEYKYTCKICNTEKGIDGFYKHRASKLGHDATCMICRRAKVRKSLPEYYIYVISHPKFNGWVKIGRAKDVSNRLGSYNTGCPYRAYEVNYSVFVGNPIEIENHFRDNIESNGYEWFKISVEEAIKIIKSFK